MTNGKRGHLFLGNGFRYGRHRARMRRAIASVVVLGALAAGLSACQPRIDIRGNLPDPELVAKLQPGIHDRDQVARLLGTPSTVGTFDDRTWYYISKRTKSVAFFRPELVDQQVLAVEFDSAGVLKEVKLYGKDDGREVELVERETPTHGRDISVLQQFLGNLGRFNRVENER